MWPFGKVKQGEPPVDVLSECMNAICELRASDTALRAQVAKMQGTISALEKEVATFRAPPPYSVPNLYPGISSWIPNVPVPIPTINPEFAHDVEHQYQSLLK